MVSILGWWTCCFVRRIWAHEISFFGPRTRDIAHLAQARLSLRLGFSQVCSTLLILVAIFGRLRRRMLSCFNSSRVALELVPTPCNSPPFDNLPLQLRRKF